MSNETSPIISNEDKPFNSFDEALYRYTQFLIQEESIPDDIKARLWAFSDKENALSNIDKGTIRNMINYLEITYNYYTMSKPDYKFTFDDEIIHAQMKAKLIVKLSRSKEGFERRMQSTQIREVHMSERENQGILARAGGFISRLTGRR